ncbi:MAG: phospholipase A [Tepidisphaeraceae bacterium]
MRRPTVALASLVAGAMIAGMLLCSVARAQERDPVRFRQHMPMYFSTDYSNSVLREEGESPNVKAQASMAASVLRAPVVIGGLHFDPYLAFTWRAVDWPVGAESSPIQENNYLPEAFIRINENGDGLYRGARVGWLHNSSGTDSMSASIDRVLLETKFAHDVLFSFGGSPATLYLYGYVRGWYVMGTGMETEGIKDYINFGMLEDVGGELMAVAEIPEAVRAVVTLGLSYQNYELYIPLAKAYDLSLFGQLYNGYADGIMNYADRHTSGGVGIALVR